MNRIQILMTLDGEQNIKLRKPIHTVFINNTFVRNYWQILARICWKTLPAHVGGLCQILHSFKTPDSIFASFYQVGLSEFRKSGV